MESAYNMLENVINSFDSEQIWRETFLDQDIQNFIIKELIQDDQLMKRGVDDKDKIIGYYSKATEIITGGRKKEGTPYNLFDTGEFYRSMEIEVESDYFMVDADPIKIDETGNKTNLFIRYGEGIIGLTQQNTDKLVEKIREKYLEKIEQLLFQY